MKLVSLARPFTYPQGEEGKGLVIARFILLECNLHVPLLPVRKDR